jgi:hypothetical protein
MNFSLSPLSRESRTEFRFYLASENSQMWLSPVPDHGKCGHWSQHLRFACQRGVVDFGDKRLCEFGNRNHIPHDFASFFISHFIPGKQHNRRFPEPSMSHAFAIRRLRVSGCLAVLIENIQSRRAIGVMSSHPACACGAAARALRRSIGTLISGSSPVRIISTVTASPASARAASRMVLLTLSP